MIVTGDEVVAYMATRLSLSPTENAMGLAAVEGGRVVAAAMYDRWSGAAVEVHVAIDGARPSLTWTACFLDYPFHQLEVDKVVAWVRESNQSSLSLCSRVGFSEEGRVSEFFENGESVIIMTLHKKDCKLLENKSLMRRCRNEKN